MQINKLLCIIHTFVKVVCEKIAFEDIIFVSENLRINIKTCLFAETIFHKLKNKLIQTGPKTTYRHVISCFQSSPKQSQ
jgi:hypothetical protein